MAWFNRKIVPEWEFYIQWFDTKEKYCDYYWITKRTLKQQEKYWTCLNIYHIANRANRPDVITYKLIRVKAIEVIKMLHMNWIVDMFGGNLKISHNKKKWLPWYYKIWMLSIPVRNEINKRLLGDIQWIINEIWTGWDKKVAEGFLIPTKEDEQIRDRITRPKT